MSSTTIHFPSGRGAYAPTGLAALRALLAKAFRQKPTPRVQAARPTAREVLREAAAVRALAQTYALTDRGFAADLFAAADRHERLYADSSGEE